MHQKGKILYVLVDFVSAALAWTFFYLYRKYYNEHLPFSWDFLFNIRYYLGVVGIPLCWTIVFAIFDSYRSLYRLSRLGEIGKTLWVVFVGSVALFFSLILDDLFAIRQSFLSTFLALYLIHIFFLLLGRIVLLTLAKQRLKNGKISFKTIIVGNDKNALDLYQEMTGMIKQPGFNFIGYLRTNELESLDLSQHIPCLGGLSELENIIKQNEVEEVIIAIESAEHNKIKEIIDVLYSYNVFIHLLPDMYDIMIGTAKVNHVFGVALIDVRKDLMPTWQVVVKRMLDIVVSISVLILLSWLYIYVAIRVKLSSKGPIFFTQERIGWHGKPFMIVKFRSMFTDAEQAGPQLSSDTDARITSWGRVIRKYRLDEIPQFWNVLKGEMSLVGPRPERTFFLNKIREQAPHVRHLQRVRPGITSLGQVKYGYASSVAEMIKRLKYDLLYIENMSLALDFKILFYTVLVILKGKGK